MSAPPGAPILIALPSGLVTSGVVAWAVRLVNAFATQGRLAGLILHGASRGYAPLDIALHYNVRVHDLSDLPPLDQANGDLSPFIPRYRDALHDLALKSGHPVALSPNLLGDCYGVAAAIALVEPEIVRILGWAHVDLPYEVAVLKHFEPAIARFVACSRVLEERLGAAIPARHDSIAHVPYGVTIPAARTDAPNKEPYQGQRPLRLIYSGRIEQDVKRVGALVHLSDELAARGIAHQLTLLGDGPAAAEIDRACATRHSISRLPAVSSERVHAVLEQQDIFVMASRVEGLSVSLLEAMACGCVPVITRTRSGSAEAITEGVNGQIVDWDQGALALSSSAPRGTGGPPVSSDHARLGSLLADGVCSVVAKGLGKYSAAARATVRDRFSHEQHVARTLDIVDQITAQEPRTWPASRPCAFTAVGAALSQGSGTVPADAGERFERVLNTLAGKRVIIHGTGQHTREVERTLARYLATTSGTPRAAIVAFADDDPTRHTSRILGLPIISPGDAHSTGTTDVIISSFINQDDIWNRRAVYEAQGLKVHRLYPPQSSIVAA